MGNRYMAREEGFSGGRRSDDNDVLVLVEKLPGLELMCVEFRETFFLEYFDQSRMDIFRVFSVFSLLSRYMFDQGDRIRVVARFFQCFEGCEKLDVFTHAVVLWSE